MDEKEKFIWNVQQEEIHKEKEQIKKIHLENKKLSEERKANRLKRKKKRRQKRMIKISISLILIIMFIMFLSVPYIKVKEVKIINNKYLSEQYIQDVYTSVETTNVSIFDLLLLPNKMQQDKYLEKVYIKYKQNKLEIKVDELKPLYHDTEQTYFLTNDNKLIEGDTIFATPFINKNNMTNDEINDIIKQINKLKLDVLLQIKSIEKNKEDKKSKRLIIQMYDGNTIYILQPDIFSKLQYYNQMKEVLESQKKGPGNIYLDIGDYYEPKN